ncbi:unnamed protein product [Ilex paraguariensis]|uniref:Uncharacterized protein n=1 Tax=Ilex paraguariensis TaxID=185542 RepID=A0ABC8SW22_9AQUA
MISESIRIEFQWDTGHVDGPARGHLVESRIMNGQAGDPVDPHGKGFQQKAHMTLKPTSCWAMCYLFWEFDPYFHGLQILLSFFQMLHACPSASPITGPKCEEFQVGSILSCLGLFKV